MLLTPSELVEIQLRIMHAIYLYGIFHLPTLRSLLRRQCFTSQPSFLCAPSTSFSFLHTLQRVSRPCHMSCDSLQNMRFTSSAAFTQVISRFPSISSLKLADLTWPDASRSVFPQIQLQLQDLDLQIDRTTGPWVASEDYRPMTRNLAVRFRLPATSGELEQAARDTAAYLQNLNAHLIELTFHPWTTAMKGVFLSLLALPSWHLTASQRI